MNPLESLKMRWVVFVWNHTPNCAEMSKLASQALDRKLPWNLWLKVRLHYLICCWCDRYAKQLQFLRQAAPLLGGRLGDLPAHGLSLDARRRILQRIQDVKAS